MLLLDTHYFLFPYLLPFIVFDTIIFRFFPFVTPPWDYWLDIELGFGPSKSFWTAWCPHNDLVALLWLFSVRGRLKNCGCWCESSWRLWGLNHLDNLGLFCCCQPSPRSPRRFRRFLRPRLLFGIKKFNLLWDSGGSCELDTWLHGLDVFNDGWPAFFNGGINDGRNLYRQRNVVVLVAKL